MSSSPFTCTTPKPGSMKFLMWRSVPWGAGPTIIRKRSIPFASCVCFSSSAFVGCFGPKGVCWVGCPVESGGGLGSPMLLYRKGIITAEPGSPGRVWWSDTLMTCTIRGMADFERLVRSLSPPQCCRNLANFSWDSEEYGSVPWSVQLASSKKVRVRFWLEMPFSSNKIIAAKVFRVEKAFGPVWHWHLMPRRVERSVRKSSAPMTATISGYPVIVMPVARTSFSMPGMAARRGVRTNW